MRIVITSDGSELSERAMAALAPWVRSWGAETWLLTVLDPRESHETLARSGHPVAPVKALQSQPALGGVPIERPTTIAVDRGKALDAARTSTEDHLRDLAAKYLPGVNVRVKAAFGEHAADAIAEFVREQNIDFVALSTHGRSGIGQALLGSVASAVARHSRVPVVIVGPDVEVSPAS